LVLNAIGYKQKNKIIHYKGQALCRLSSIHTTDTALDRQKPGKQKQKNRKNEKTHSSSSQLGPGLYRRANQLQYKIAFMSVSQSSVFFCNLYTSDYQITVLLTMPLLLMNLTDDRKLLQFRNLLQRHKQQGNTL